MASRYATKAVDWIYWALLALILIMPFHAVITNHLAIQFGYQNAINAWKEVVVVIASAVAVSPLVLNSKLRAFIFNQLTTKLILIYIVLHSIYFVIFANSLRAEVVGLRSNLIFLVVFFLAQVAGYHHSYKKLSIRLMYFLVFTAVAVSLLGIAQALVPTNLAALLDTSLVSDRPFMFVQDSPILRINSTLWGPSQLGSYLILPLVLAIWWRIKSKDWRWSLAVAPISIALFASQSRAAWVAAIFAILFMLAWPYRHRFSKKALIVSAISLAIIGTSTLFAIYRTNTPFSNLIFHASSQNAISQSSNSDRFSAIERGLRVYSQNPLGDGVGSAGPASTYNDVNIYTESYYIQLLIEVGPFGLLIFIAICISIIRTIASQVSAKPMLLPILASFFGLILMNAVHHTWTDATTAIVWWGSAGFLLASRK